MSQIIVGTYEIIGQIGSGGGGIVYLANHLRLGKRVVLKADKRRLTTKPEALRREVDVLKNLSHTYIPQVYDFFVEGETVYTVMDYIDGESLDKPLKSGERFPQSQVVGWAIELLEALSYLHSPTHGDPPHGIVHSDIKPANIMLRPSGDICLIDFNIALAIGEDNVIGRSDGYSSPEHYGLDFSFSGNDTEGLDSTEVIEDAGETVVVTDSSTSSKKVIVPDARSDIYSLGATLYHFLSGEKPNKNAKEVIPLSEKAFSRQIVAIITKAMNPNPDLRYQSADEMLRAFRNLRKNDPRTKRLRRARVSVAAASAFVFAVGAFSSFTGLKRMEQTQRNLTMAEYSQNALEAGDTENAIKYALRALPQKSGIFDPPWSSQAKKALTDATGVYNLSEGFKANALVTLPSETFKTVLSPDGKTCAALYTFEMALVDTASGKIIKTLPLIESALADAVFVGNDVVIYAGADGITAYNIKNDAVLWTGKPTTGIAVSADGSTVAAVNRDEQLAYIYDIDGTERGSVSFEGKSQKVVSNDTFGDPNDSLFSLNATGQYLAVSFSNGGLYVYDTADPENTIEIYDASDYFHFEGGFYGQYFAFSSTKDGESVFAVIDMSEFTQTGGFDSVSRFGVYADENGILLSNEGVLVNIHPVTGEQKEVAYTTMPIRSFSSDGKNTVIVTENNDIFFFDENSKLTSEYSFGQNSCDFALVGGDSAVLAGRDTPELKLLRYESHKDADVLNYVPYEHDELRINKDGTKLTLFNYKNFRLCDIDGNIIADTEIPDAENVYDQQYSKESGNLAVIYPDALRIYSGENGALVFEETGLKSVSYAPYGISILRPDGTLLLVDRDTGAAEEKCTVNGNFGAWCGVIVDDKLLNGGDFVGSGQTGGQYYFAVNRGDSCSVYNGKGDKLFAVPALERCETFYAAGAVILSPLHGTPVAYSLSTGKKIAELEKDAYLTYVTELDKYVLSEYISTEGERYGILLDKSSFEPLAHLPSLTDIYGDELLFDYKPGTLRKSRIYSIDELISIAKGGDAAE